MKGGCIDKESVDGMLRLRRGLGWISVALLSRLKKKFHFQRRISQGKLLKGIWSDWCCILYAAKLKFSSCRALTKR